MTDEVFFNVVLEAKSNSGSWEETETLELARLGEPEACDLAEIHAERLSAHWGHIQWRRWGKRTWKIWEPGEDGVEAWVRVVPVDECSACAGDEAAELRCPSSQRPCGHHCNCVMIHDYCHWCKTTWGEDGEESSPNSFTSPPAGPILS